MNVTIVSRHSKTIQKLVEEQMKKEAKELGFDPWGDTAHSSFSVFMVADILTSTIGLGY